MEKIRNFERNPQHGIGFLAVIIAIMVIGFILGDIFTKPASDLQIFESVVILVMSIAYSVNDMIKSDAMESAENMMYLRYMEKQDINDLVQAVNDPELSRFTRKTIRDYLDAKYQGWHTRLTITFVGEAA